MKRRGWVRGRTPQNRNQLSMDWEASAHEGHAPTNEGDIIAGNRATIPPLPTEPIVAPTSLSDTIRHRRKEIVARLPVPRPLPAAVAAGNFGHDEAGRPIRPAADEVRAITESQADQLIDMLDAVKATLGKPAEALHLPESFNSILAAYAEDFGERAARQLEAYARRQASLDDTDRTDPGWHR